ncbi:MAG: magnesium transporter CorA family protein [Burkholderiaceae bacterium]
MRWITLTPTGVSQSDRPVALPAEAWVWFDALHEEVAADRIGFADAVEQLTGRRLFELHVSDAVNLQHPSYFDSTEHYDMLVFRKLATAEGPPLAEQENLDSTRALHEIETRPITFFVFDRVLVTVRNRASKTIEQAQARLFEARARANEERIRQPTQPLEFMLRLLNGMVDRYLELRQPLTERLDRWQRALLDPRRSFGDWSALLEARIEIRKLENLCEGQYDALQEMRDEYLQSTPENRQSDAFLVRLNDVMEHVQRVLLHTRRLEVSAESAVQLHFSATAHRTNQVIRTLTVITAIFAPLTLITGIFGMNFQYMPMVEKHDGVYYVLGGMLALSILLLAFFWTRRVISDRPAHLRLRVLRWLRQRPRSP